MKHTVSQSSAGSQSGIVTNKEIEELLPFSQRKIQELRKQGILPFITLPGTRTIVYEWASVMEALRRYSKGGIS